MNLLFISTILYVLIAGSPEGPVTGPQLVTTGPGLFQLKHTVSSPAQNTAHPVGLVYHIVDILTRVTVFMSQVWRVGGREISAMNSVTQCFVKTRIERNYKTIIYTRN